jgi:hypothetical protein
MNHANLPLVVRSLLALVVASWAVPPARAEPAEVKRVVRTFDFEERRLGNVEDLPMHWAKVAGPGMPHYVNGRLATDAARSGRYSFRLDLDGGSVAYRYAADRIRVMTGAHYRVEAAVRTTVLPNARARLTGFLVDLDGRMLEGTLRHADPYAARSADEGWRTLSVEVAADDPRAAFLVLEVGLVQPALYAPQTLGPRQLNPQDIRGSAWFDDITVSQVPRVSLGTNRPANVFRRGDKPRLIVRVDDRFTDDLAARLEVADADGRLVHVRTELAELGRAEQVGPGRRRMTVDLPELPAGLYRVALTTSSQGQLLGTESLAFAQLADANPPARTDGRLGVVATSLPFAAWDELPEVLPMLSAGRVKLALWGRDQDIQDQDSGKLDALLEKLQGLGITATGCLLDLPPGIRNRIAVSEYPSVGATGTPAYRGTPVPQQVDTTASSWPLLLRADTKVWQPHLALLVARHANHLDRWQIGEDGTDAFVRDPKMRAAYGAVYAEFRKLVERPDLAMPWPAWCELDGAAPATVALAVSPTVVLPSQVPLYLSDLMRTDARGAATDPFANRGGAQAPGAGRPTGPGPTGTQPAATSSAAVATELAVTLSWLDRDTYGRQEQLRDLAQRVVYALSAGASRIDFPLPLVARRSGDSVVREPTEELIVLRTMIATLGGAAYKGKVPIAEGVEAFLFDRDGRGVLAVWDRGAQPGGVRELAITLGADPAMVDLWGNATPLPKLRGQGGRVSLSVGRLPTFIVDVDGELMQTRASVALDRPLIESSFQPHARRLRFVNAYKTAMSGTVRLKPPPGWVLTPSSFAFTLNPGEAFDRDLTIELPYNSVGGPRSIDANFALQADAVANATFSVPVAVTLGLSDVGTQTLAFRDGDALVVQQMITNYSDRPIDYTAFVVVPGQARQERLLAGLEPGKTALKRYRFAGVKMPSGGKLRAGVKETDGSRILNEEVEVR